MGDARFYKFSPSGNDTVFVERRDFSGSQALCAAAMRAVGGEQAAAVDLEGKRARMAGGEFCVNAARALGALLDYRGVPADGARDGGRVYRARISGCVGELELLVSGSAPRWAAAALIPFAQPPERAARPWRVLDLPGISHALLEAESFPPREEARRLAGALEPALGGATAWGAVWWRRRGEACEIFPYVTVPEAGTAFFERSCGSASLALAAALGEEKLTVLQPSGDALAVALDKGRGLASITGPVALLAEGEIYF